MATRIPLLMLALLLAGTAAAAPDVQVADRRETYAVSGDGPRAMWEQMQRIGPVDGNEGKRYAGNTRWHVAWDYSFVSDGHSCRLADPHVAVTIVTTLPQWADFGHAPRALQTAWFKFTTKLREHEAGHRQNGLLAAQEISQILAGTPPRLACTGFESDLDAATNAVIHRYNEADREYDAATQHGEKQGAVFP